jgi:hypothetical protein
VNLHRCSKISGFATMYGAMQAALPADQAGTVQHNAAQVQPLARAAASGRYTNLAAPLTAGGSPRSQDDIFASCIDHLIDLAGPFAIPVSSGDAVTGHKSRPTCPRAGRDRPALCV